MDFVWTAEAIEQLRALWPLGLSMTELGRRIGTTKNSIAGKATRLNLERGPRLIEAARSTFWTDEKKAELQNLRRQGFSLAEIARVWNQPYSMIKGFAYRFDRPQIVRPFRTVVEKIKKHNGLNRLAPVAPMLAVKPTFAAPQAKAPRVRPPVYVPIGPCLWPDKCPNSAFPVRPYSYCLEHRKIAYDRDGALYNYQLQCGWGDAA